MEDLVNYIKRNLKKGYTKESLKWALLNQGYSKIEVERALRKVDFELAQEAPQLEAKPNIKREVLSPKKQIHEEKKGFWKRLFGG